VNVADIRLSGTRYPLVDATSAAAQAAGFRLDAIEQMRMPRLPAAQAVTDDDELPPHEALVILRRD
jgi:hypothetical protein